LRSEIGALDAWIGEQGGPGALEGDAPGLQHVAAVAELERLDHPLFD
jgi:hypothetical protein